MRQLLLSDIHSNMEALDACVERGRAAGFDAILCCGDVVGYGPEPNQAVEFLRQAQSITIRGNHDRVAAGREDPVEFNVHAAQAAIWTRTVLTPENRSYLRSLPVGPLEAANGALLVHGAVTDEDDYIMCASDAAGNFALTPSALTFFGHTHFQCVYSCKGSGEVGSEVVGESDGVAVLDLQEGIRYLVNPGSVGQPRDNDTRAGFAIWDTRRKQVEFYRVPYPMEITQSKMREAELPAYLIDRLSHGR
jgi:predicted phosphodiesterase